MVGCQGSAALAESSPRSRLPVLRAIRLIALALLIAYASGARAAADDTAQQSLDVVRSSLADIESALKSDNLSDADLQRLRAQGDPLAVELQAVITSLTPRLQASHKRLAELTPKSKDATLSDSANADLAAERQKDETLDAEVRSARAMLLQIDDNNARISAARRAIFARETFARSSSVLSPLLWASVARETPADLAAVGAVLADWLHGLAIRIGAAQAFGLLAVALAIAALWAPLHWVARRVIARDPQVATPSRLRRAFAAAWTIIVLAALPLLAMSAIVYALDAFDISDPRLQGALDALLDGLRLVVVANALARGLLAPRLGNWRVVDLDDRVAKLLFRLWLAVAVILAVERLLEPAADAAASLNIAVAGRAAGAALVGMLMARTLRLVAAAAPSPAAGGSPREFLAPMRALLWAIVAVILGAALSGYIAFATFLANQMIFVAMLGTGLYLIDIIVRQGAEEYLRPNAVLGRGLMTMIGLRRDALEQLVVLIQGVARLAIFVVAAGLIVGPWGVSQDLDSTLRTVYFGFIVGGVTLSLSSLVGAMFVLVIGVVATRATQNWLAARYLPRTRLDSGVRNSIGTIVGYLGVLIALVLSGAQLGLDYQKLALVAGALSVGIGFGLQSIANNFVSGLILLWERGIRVGDWVVVGAEQGYVRRINARATEIETFDRGTLIVPNATLVGGAVKNWMHADRTGRIVVAVNVPYESDLEVVRELLIAAAKAQEHVLTIPAPLALFSEFGDWALKFQLTCFVDDIVMAERVRSEMNFDIFHRMREAGIRVPYPK
jgi:potassium-dependent mechanosensitive channel